MRLNLLLGMLIPLALASPRWKAPNCAGGHVPTCFNPSAAEMPSANSSEDDNPTTADGHTAVDSGVGAQGESENALLERAIGLVRSVFNKDPS
jgi:hypothetical protein